MRITTLGSLGVVAAAMLCLSTAAQADEFMGTSSTKAVLQGNFEAGGASVFLDANSNARRVGTGGAGGAQRVNQPVLGFLLPTVTAGEVITSVRFSMNFDTAAVNGAPIGFDGVVSLMNYDVVTDFTGADFTENSGALGNGTLVRSFAAGDADVADNGTINFDLSGASLALFQGFYDAGGNPLQTDAFFRISTSATIDTTVAANDNDRFNIATDGGGAGDPLVRSLTITTAAVPEPSSLAVLGLAGIGMCVRRRKRS